MITGDDLPAERFVVRGTVGDASGEFSLPAVSPLAHVGELEGLLLTVAALWVEASLAAWSPWLGSSEQVGNR
jgi:hypothetical protein